MLLTEFKGTVHTKVPFFFLFFLKTHLHHTDPFLSFTEVKIFQFGEGLQRKQSKTNLCVQLPLWRHPSVAMLNGSICLKRDAMYFSQ